VTQADGRPVVPVLRWTLWTGAWLASVAGTQTYVGSSHTDKWFAWTIKPSLTAAFLGALYFTAVILLAAAARERFWAGARVATMTALNLVVLVAVATFVHLSKFHLHSDSAVTLAGTWAFLVTYVYLALALAGSLAVQLRAPGGDPPRVAPLPEWARLTLVAQAVPLLVGGAMLLSAPSATAGIWPWTLTPLTGRAIGAWLWSVGVAAALGAWERDWRRIRVPLAAYAVLPVLETIALLRYRSTVDWNHPTAWIIVAYLASMVVLGFVGLRAGAETRRAAKAGAPTTA
jgi:hypothetical protein